MEGVLFSIAEILVRDGTAGAGGMAPTISTRISDRMKCGQGHSSPVNVHTHAKHDPANPKPNIIVAASIQTYRCTH